ACAERRQDALIPRRIVAGTELLEPVDVAPEPAESLDVLHVDPEMPAATGKVRHVERGENDRGHFQPGNTGVSASNQRSTSASCTQPQSAGPSTSAAAGQIRRLA